MSARAEKLDLFKLHKAEYSARRKPTLVEIGPGSYLTVRGRGAPGSELFSQRAEVLYAMAYTLKFESKFAGRDYTVSKLEGLYGVDGQSMNDLTSMPMSDWNWRLMIRQPDFIVDDNLAAARETLRAKGKEGDFEAATLETLEEGTCVQMLHVGPYEEESRTVEAMTTFAAGEGLTPNLWHHEIYLSDPRRVPPERLRTILRLPVG